MSLSFIITRYIGNSNEYVCLRWFWKRFGEWTERRRVVGHVGDTERQLDGLGVEREQRRRKQQSRQEVPHAQPNQGLAQSHGRRQERAGVSI